MRIIWSLIFLISLSACVFFEEDLSLDVQSSVATHAIQKFPKIVFVIDDMGNTNEHISELEKLRNNVTYAILPQLPHTDLFNRISRHTGAEVILHLPLRAVSGQYPGPGVIHSGMSDEQISSGLRRNLASVYMHVGVNNHMGSLGTSKERLMTIILSELGRRNLFFLDSYTSPFTVTKQIAKRQGLSRLRRDVFIDNEDDYQKIYQQARKTAAIARKKGYAIGIGHYRLNTLKVLQDIIPRLRAEGYEVTTLKKLAEFQKWKLT